MAFKGKVVLITGSSSGIGANAARHLAKLGAKVSIVDKNGERLNEVAKEIKDSGATPPLSIVADVTKDAERIVQETINHFGQLDVLINNAGIVNMDTVIGVNLSEFDRVFDVNVRGAIILTKFSVPYLEKTKGNVLNVSSVGGLKAKVNSMTYCMSKAALDQFTKCSALDLAPKGIRVNSINPAIVRTRLFESYGSDENQYEQRLEDRKNRYPLGRVGEVSDTSAAIAYLADNDLASFLTGVLLPVDGGAMVAGV